MIVITKKHGKWNPGDCPTMGIGTAEDLVNLGVAEWQKGWGRYGYTDKRNKVKTKTKIENGNNG